MTEVHFYTGLADKIHTACGLVGKAVQRGKRVVVFSSDAPTLTRFDQALWSFDPLSFVPHVSADDPLADQTPVLLLAQAPADDQALPHHEVLVNLDSALPKFFSRFDYLMELVGETEYESAAGRERWKFYKERGYTVQHHAKTTPK